jgi:AcrR family transcriptional regulator
VLALAWGLGERARRGPRPRLSLDEVVTRAIAIADEEGLAALSMARLAQALGYTTMSVYRYVESKDDLLQLMVDRAAGDPPPPPDAGDWRSGLRDWAWWNLRHYRRHPWVLDVPVSGPPMLPSQLAWMDRALGCLDGTGLGGGEQLLAVLAVTTYVRGQGRLELELSRGAQAAGVTPAEAGEAYWRALAHLADPARFPALHRLVAGADVSQSGETDDDEDFEFGLAIVLDGIAARVNARTPPKRPRRTTR